MAFPSLTKTWHSEAYPAIAPSRPELSAQGKIVVITGGGGSIGGAIALAFAQAGAQGIAIIGRRNEPLQETRKKVESEVPGARIITVSGDLSDADSMKDALQTVSTQLGPVNVLVANAGFLPHMGKIDEADPDEWWTGFETNTKGAFNTCRALLPVAAPDCLLLDISTCVVHLPAMITASGYVSSKLAGTKVYETFAAENPGRIQVIHIHPGVVYSELNVKSGVAAADNANLPGCFVLWAASDEAKPFRGKYLWVNWDVPELLARKDELTKPNQLSITLNGWPFSYSSGVELKY